MLFPVRIERLISVLEAAKIVLLPSLGERAVATAADLVSVRARFFVI